MGAVHTGRSKPAANFVTDLAEVLVCAVISGKAGAVAEPDEVLEDLTRNIGWAVAGLPGRGLADYDGVDLRLTSSGLRKASAPIFPSRRPAEPCPKAGGKA